MTWTRAALLLAAILASPGASTFTRDMVPDTVERDQVYADGTRVLIIAVSSYRDPGWPKLETRRDAERIRQLFRQRGVPESAITTVEPSPERDSDLRAAILRFGESLPAGADNPLHVVVYYAGHGSSEGAGYLVPPNAPNPARQPTEFKLAALPMSTLLSDVSTFRAAHVMLILDSCFSGLALESLPRERFPGPQSSGAERKILQVITAGTLDQPVADDGLFAQLVATGLTGSADLNFDGWISGTELGMYLRLRVTETSRRLQTPTFGNITGLGYEVGENWFASSQRALQSATSRLQLLENSGSAFQDCEDCPLLRVVPAPTAAGESPVSALLAMGVREVSFEEFDACFKAAGCRHWPWSASGERGRMPVTDVSLADANEYTSWLSCVSGKRYRVPTDAEWRTAAEPERERLTRGSARPGAVLANCRGCGSRWDGESLAPTGSFAPSELGLFDLVGNAWEWTDECTVAGRAASRCAQTIVRGGAFTTRRSIAIGLPSAGVSPLTRDRNIGFRVLREIDETSPAARTSCEAAGN